MAIITIGGKIGAGKTSLAEGLSAALGYDQFSTGGLFRKMAEERGLSLEDFYAALKSDPAIERKADAQQKKLMNEQGDLVVQGRMAWYFAKGSPFTIFNIFLDVDPEIGAKRSAERPENSGRTHEELLRANAARMENEIVRYGLLYGIENFLDPGHYDFVLDTSDLTIEEVLQKIVTKLSERIEFDV